VSPGPAPCGIDFGELYRLHAARSTRPAKSADDWDARAPGMSRGAFDSDYVRGFVERLRLDGCATLLDVGCGPGNIALSVAPRLQHVYGLDHSPAMLAAFAENARERGVGHATPILRSWTDDWSDVPVCDVVVASRSTAVADLEAALKKIETKARVRAAITYPTEGHFVPAGVLRAIGRAGDDLPDFLFVAGILRDMGRYPTLDYLPGRSRLANCRSFDDVAAKVTELLGALTSEEVARLRDHYGASNGTLGRQPTRWVLFSWETGEPGERAAALGS
jgi:SAM-dependent methyltransferase